MLAAAIDAAGTETGVAATGVPVAETGVPALIGAAELEAAVAGLGTAGVLRAGVLRAGAIASAGFCPAGFRTRKKMAARQSATAATAPPMAGINQDFFGGVSDGIISLE